MTKRLMVGDVAVGGGAPVSIQSMCNTKTDDAAATVAQIHALEAAGCEAPPQPANSVVDIAAASRIARCFFISIPPIFQLEPDAYADAG